MRARARGLDHGGLPWLTGMPHSHGLCRLCAVLLAHPQAHLCILMACGVFVASWRLACSPSITLYAPQSHSMLCPLCSALSALPSLLSRWACEGAGKCECASVTLRRDTAKSSETRDTRVRLSHSHDPCTSPFFLVIKFGHFKLSSSIFLSARSARTHHSCNCHAPHTVVCQFEIGGCTSCVGLCVGV